MGVVESRWQEAKPLLEQALTLAASQRKAFVVEACSDDLELQDYLLQLVTVEDTELTWFDKTELVLTDSEREELGLVRGDRLGSYEIIEPLGAGGMGRVYVAVHKDQPFEKHVALKVLAAGKDPADSMRRFRHECQVLARLEHPHIARILDGGATPQGQLFIVMEWVRGEELSTYLAKTNLELDSLLQLVEQMCEAVHFAHQNLIIHRDLKPGNIRVTQEGQPVILDFGIAKLLDPDEPSPAQTRTGKQRLTPEYASPEQWVNGDITTAVDVYGMGVILYQALTMQRPYDLWEQQFPGLGVRGVLTEEVPLASQSLRQWLRADRSGTQTSESPRPKPTRWSPEQLRGDLDAILHKALQIEPTKRYRSLANLAEDLRRFREGQPVTAHRDSFVYRLRKLVRRHRIAVTLSLGLVMGLILLSGALFIQRKQTDHALSLANHQMTRAGELNRVVMDLFRKPDPYLQDGSALTVRQLIEQSLGEISVDSIEQAEIKIELLRVFAQALVGMGEIEEALDQLDRAQILANRYLISDHPARAQIMAARGGVFLWLADLPEAARWLEMALPRLETSFSPDAPECLVTLRNAAMLDMYYQRNQSALATLRRARTIHEAHPDRLDLNPALTHDLIAQAHILLGDADRAAPSLALGMNVRRQLWGDDHPAVAESVRTLAGLVSLQGDLELSADLYQQALDIEQRRIRTCQLGAIFTRFELAGTLWRLGRVGEAESLYLQNTLCGEQDENACTAELMHSWLNLGLMYGGRAQYQKADHALRMAVGTAQKVFGRDSSSAAACWLNLGVTAMRLNRLTEARAYFMECVQVLQRIDAESGFEYGMVQARLAELAAAEGDWQDAIDRIGVGLTILKPLLDNQHPLFLQMQNNLEDWQDQHRAID